MEEKLGSATLDMRSDDTGLTRSVASARKSAGRLDKGFQQVTTSVRNLGTRLRAAITPMRALIGAAGLGVLASRVNTVVGEVNKLAKTAKSVDLTAEAVQELRFAFGQLADVTDTEVDLALSKFQRRIGLALNGTGAAAKAIEGMSIRLRTSSGAARDTEDILEDVVAGLAGLESGAERAGRTSEFFGDRVGPKLAVALGVGEKAIGAQRDAAQSLRIVLDEQLVGKSEEAADKLDILGRRLDTALKQSILTAIEDLIDLAEAFGQITTAAASAGGESVRFTRFGGRGAGPGGQS